MTLAAMLHLVIAVAASIILIVLAGVSRIPTYHVASAFLIPGLWAAAAAAR